MQPLRVHCWGPWGGGDGKGLRVTSRGREKGEWQQCVRARVRACVCACVHECVCAYAWRRWGRSRACLHTRRVGKAEGQGEAGGGGYRGGPRVLGASCGLGGPGPPGPPRKQPAFSGGIVLVTGHGSCAAAGAPSTRGDSAGVPGGPREAAGLPDSAPVGGTR